MMENAEDIRLLQTNPHGLVLKHQETIRIIVWNCINRGLFKPYDFADVVQSVNVALLTRMAVLQKQYNNTSLLRTYLSCIIRNICIRLAKGTTEPSTLSESNLPGSSDDTLWEGLAVQDAIHAFNEIVSLYGSQRGRLILHLKLFYKIPLEAADLLSAYPQCTQKVAGSVTDVLMRGMPHQSEQQLFAAAAPLLNRLEGKTTSPGGHRHWAGKMAHEIVNLLNSRIPGACFDKGDLGTLLEEIWLHFETEHDYISETDTTAMSAQGVASMPD